MKFKRIKDLREDNDKLQKEIAQLLGISQQYYSEYESGKRTIPITHLITLAKYYNTSIDYMLDYLMRKIVQSRINIKIKTSLIYSKSNLFFCFYNSIWLAKNVAADCATFFSTSFIFVSVSFDINITVPIVSPFDIIG